MKRLCASFALLAVMTVGLSGCIITSDDDATLTVENRSDFAIFELYLTEVDNRDWGRNLLSGDALFPGESLVLTNIRCDFYDALLVDEDGFECEVLDVDLCLNDALWIIRNNTCAIFEAARSGETDPAAGPADSPDLKKLDPSQISADRI